jgi:membrane dipeptidase
LLLNNGIQTKFVILAKKKLKKNILYTGLVMSLFACAPGVKTPEQSAKIIHEKVLTVDTHTDTPWYLLQGGFDMAERHDFEKEHSRVDFVRMKEGGLDAVFFAAFVGQRKRDEEGNRKAKEMVVATIDSIHAHLATRTAIAGIALTPDDAYRLEKEGKRIVFIGIENGYAIGNEIHNVEEFYKMGARYITLCHTKNNDICDSSTDTTGYGGLSPFGVEVVKEMNRVGMMIDVSHASDSSFYDVLAVTKAPVIASHSCSRAICDNPRNLSDDMLKQLALNGGVVQMCILSDYVKKPEPYPARDSAFKAIKDKYGNFSDLTREQEKLAWKEWDDVDSIYPPKLATVADAVDHIDHMVKVAGIDHVGIGTDFDGGGGLADCRDVSQMGNITLELVKHGYNEEDIRKIWGGNIMRVMREVQRVKE